MSAVRPSTTADGGRAATRPAGAAAVLALAVSLLAGAAAAGAVASPDPAVTPARVLVARVDGIIDGTAASYLQDRLLEAEREHAAALVLVLDTPGGLDTAMRRMVKDILAARVPVVTYVAPAGARAASAGVFLVYAAHLAAMAPGTNVGAAHPVGLGGSLPDVELEKATNDAAAYLRSLARLRGRDERFAEEAVRRSVSVTAEEALQRRVVDLLAPDLPSLLERLDGRRVTTAGGQVVLRTRGAAVVERPMTFRQRLLHALADPNLAYLLLILGFYGLLYELASPGIGFAGVGGAIMLILGLYALNAIGVNYAGLALLVLAFGLFAAELFVPTHGALTAGGVVSLLLGSLLLVDAERGVRLSLGVILPVTIGTALLAVLAMGAGLRAQRRRVATGGEGLIGEVGVARSDLEPGGMVAVHGELWRARSVAGVIPAGARVRVVGREGLTLAVERIPEEEA